VGELAVGKGEEVGAIAERRAIESRRGKGEDDDDDDGDDNDGGIVGGLVSAVARMRHDKVDGAVESRGGDARGRRRRRRRDGGVTRRFAGR